MSQFKYWPCWFYGPKGQSQVFNSEDEVPEGWHDHPSKVGNPDAVTEIPDEEEAQEKRIEEIIAESNGDFEYWPCWFYGPNGESAIFNSEDEVPEGWTNTQGDAPEPADAAEDEEDDTDDSVDYVLPAEDDMTKDEILEQLTGRGINHNPSWKKDRLYGLLSDAVESAKDA